MKETMIQQMKRDFYDLFSNGAIDFGPSALDASLTIRFALIGNLEDIPHRIWQNDVMYHIFMVNEKDGVLERVMGSGVSVNPSAGSSMAMETRKVSFRKSKKVVPTFRKYLEGLRKVIDAERAQQNIYGQERIPTKYLN